MYIVPLTIELHAIKELSATQLELMISQQKRLIISLERHIKSEVLSN